MKLTLGPISCAPTENSMIVSQICKKTSVASKRFHFKSLPSVKNCDRYAKIRTVMSKVNITQK